MFNRSNWQVTGILSATLALVSCSNLHVRSLPLSTQTARAVRDYTVRSSWISPEARAKDLLYISDVGSSQVYIFTYPKMRQVGAISANGPEGTCVNGVGDVFVTNEISAEIIEYAHGSNNPIEVLQDDGPYGEQYAPHGCSVDQKTGNLAVTNGDSTYNNVAIYADSKGQPIFYSIPFMGQAWFCSYDDRGNLYVDGEYYGQFKFAALPFHAKKFKEIRIEGTVEDAGGVQWERNYLAVGDSQAGIIYHVRIKGSKGAVIGSTSLSGSDVVPQFWIQGRKVIGPNEYAADVGIWEYPGGGVAVKMLYGFADPFAAIVSKARH